jgi:hypothetical protein
MEDISSEQQGKITVLRDQSPSKSLVRLEPQSDIEIYKEVLSDRFKEAKTVEECEKFLALRQKVQELDTETRQLNYAQQSAEVQLKQAQHKVFFQGGQQIVAITISIFVGIYLLRTNPSVGLLLLVLGLAKPLGYSLGEIGNFFDSLKGFPKDSGKLLSNEKESIGQTEESSNAKP